MERSRRRESALTSLRRQGADSRRRLRCQWPWASTGAPVSEPPWSRVPPLRRVGDRRSSGNEFFSALAVRFMLFGVEPLSAEEIRRAVRLALAEDIGRGDVTTLATVPAGATASAVMRAREPLVVAGLGLAEA